jgi:hypothetical protein
MNKNWARWTYASIAKHFSDAMIANSIAFYSEGMNRVTQNTEWVELRIEGPHQRQLQRHEYILEASVSLIWVKHITQSELQRGEDIKGIILEAMQNICVKKYGDGAGDDETIIGTLTLNKDIRCHNLGLVGGSTLIQGLVEASFRMFLSE